jgi:RimJ/RimL family protein N-acetyltransferase
METETPRLRLRPFVPSDFDDLLQLYSDPEVMRYVGKGTRTPEETHASLERFSAHWRDLGFGMWALQLKETGEFVGRCGIFPLADTGQVEVGYTLHRRFWGRGLATEAAALSLDFGFQNVGLERIVAIARTENIGSQRVMQKIGMIYERTDPSPYDGTEVVWYAMTRDRFTRLSTAADTL